ncbi:MAG TPA: FHA domain-containing protein [Cellulomonas sp.]|uniref:FHA domain-containing protein n=1 Tax=Cellulomonas sp. TaxID=40001 RepID=UPI002E32B1C5|nr:FHA domain-containing protein [Cellulomonas sp.]HEX5331436.1 FHA domain-containing protein [Cellulomonas sp.]
MIVPEYMPGDWHAVVAGGVVALLAPSTSSDVVRAVWAAVPAQGGLADQLEALLTGGIARLQPFALVDLAGGRVHAALRGGVEIEVSGTDGTRVLSAGEVTTWSERVAEGADEVTIRVVGTPWTSDLALPVVSGVVRASVVRVPLGAREADAVMVPVAEPGVVDDGVDDEIDDAPDEAPVEAGDEAPDDALAVLDTESLPTALPVPAARDLIDHVPAAVDPAESLRRELDAAWNLSRSDEVVAQTEPALDSGSLGPVEDTVIPDDHDGMTILSSDLQTIRHQLPSWAGDEVPGPFRVTAPQLAPPAKLVLSTGQVVSVDRSVLLGRAPQVSRVTNRDLPRLVTLPSPQQDISRTHAEVRADGDAVLVTDLHSTNGTLVTRPGDSARQLAPGEATVIEHGEVVDLGDGVTFTVERGA